MPEKPVTKDEYSWLIQQSFLKTNDERIFRVLLHFQNRDHRAAVKMITMMKMTKLDRRTIQRRLSSLRSRGYLQWKNEWWSKKYGTKSYKLDWERLCDDVEKRQEVLRTKVWRRAR